jgi:hypothetical protein
MILKRLAGLLLGLLWAVAAAAAAPALVVVIVIDGLPQEQVVKYRDLYGPGGFQRLLDEGAWFGNAHHGHAVTLTAPGHATVLTGTYPYRHGVIANEWVDRDSFGPVYCTGDENHKYIGDETRKLDGTSPANLRVTTVGDELKYATNGQSKVVAISGKDRGAILLAGKRGTAYMYMDKSGRFASSTYYMKAHPEWHARYYAGKPQDKWMGQAWAPLLAEAAYARSIPEGQPWHPRDFAGMGARFPFQLPKADKAQAYYAALIRTPYGDEATLDFARAAIEGEDLGRNPAGVPDLLGISLSTHDYVNHGFGPESRVSEDHLLRVDRALAAFFDDLDRRVGLDRVVVALTADHGFMNAPEYSAAIGLAGARLNAAKLMTDLNTALSERFGVKGNLAPRFSYPTILLDQRLIAENFLNRYEVESFAQRHLLATPGIAGVATRTQLENGVLPDLPLSVQMLRAWNRELSGDLYVVQNPFTLFGGNVVTHGSPYGYDTNVPLMLYGKPWIRPGKQPRAASVADIAPTLSYLLEIRPPAASEGRVLEEALK